ncbi:MAG: FAD-binding oxidoreductase [Chloroflexi bacterium]|nr:FAD-binding oxidoreductase [Chloroflexota bacterium]
MRDFRVDGLIPGAVVSPTQKSDVALHLSELFGQGKKVVPWGGGTRMAIGNVPTSYDVALDLSGVKSNVEHVAGDMTVVCDAGVKISELSSMLAESNQRLPFEIMRPSEATIGGSVASNAPSRLAPRFGGIRDWVIGMSVVLADGTPTKTGGRVVKNVQGYDLHRLHTGAFGSLGVIVSVAIKLIPIAGRTQTVAMWFDRLSAAANAASDVSSVNVTMEAARLYSGPAAVGAIRELAADRHMDAEVTSDGTEFLMLVQVAGSKAALIRQVNELTGLAGTVPATGYEVLSGVSEADVWTYADATGNNATVRVRVAAKPSVCVDLISRFERLLGRTQAPHTSTIFDVGYGSMQFNIEEIGNPEAIAFVDDATRMVRDVGGSLMVEQCPVEVKSGIDVFGIDASSAQIMKNMKKQFDPHRILNPGRFAFKI